MNLLVQPQVVCTIKLWYQVFYDHFPGHGVHKVTNFDSAGYYETITHIIVNIKPIPLIFIPMDLS